MLKTTAQFGVGGRLWRYIENHRREFFSNVLNYNAAILSAVDKEGEALRCKIINKLIFNNLHNPPPSKYFAIIVNPLCSKQLLNLVLVEDCGGI
jgi:hypothetical protein